MKHVKEIIAEAIFLISALASIFAVAMICFFLFANGLPAIFKIGPLKFLTGTIWKPGNDIYGIFPMILGSIYVTAGAILIGVPIGILTAIYLSRFCPRGIYHVIKPAMRSAGRYSIRSLRIFRYGGDRTGDGQDRTGSYGIFPYQWKMQRKEYCDCIDLTGNHDPSNDHRCSGICDQCGS